MQGQQGWLDSEGSVEPDRGQQVHPGSYWLGCREDGVACQLLPLCR